MPETSILADARPLEHAVEDFAGAELTLVYDRETSAKNPTRSLVFAVVELLHEGLEFGPELPISQKDSCFTLKQSSRELNLRRVRLTVKEGLDWYRACADGRAEIPLVGWERAKGNTPHSLQLPPFSEEPRWPYAVLEAEKSFWGDAPFWGYRPGGTRRHQLISESADFTVQSWSKEDRDKARKWLREQLPIDIFERPRLLGSIHLVLTNPVFGRLHIRMNKDDPAEARVRVQRWPGRALSGLHLHVRHERPTGPMSVHRVPLQHPHTALKFESDPHFLSFDILSESHGLLHASKPSTAIGEVRMTMNVVTRHRRISVPARSRKRGPQTYSVPVALPRESTTGSNPLPAALSLLLEDEQDFRQRQQALELGQRWFDGNVEEATEFLQKLIQEARREILIVDAYFGYTELLRYALVSKVLGVQVQIMTSQEYLDKTPEGEGTTTQGSLLSAALGQVLQQDSSLKIEIRVGTGKKAPVHDRFLVLDGNIVWLLGSSLNEFGKRGTTVVRLPHAGPIRQALLLHWDAATPLEEFMARPGASEPDAS